MDISRADMALLVSLDVLLRERSVTAAARRLGISQPAMSSQLAKLRTLFDDPVLVADGSRMVPTARVAGLEQPLRQQLSALQDLAFRGTAFDPTTARRTFRVAATDYAHAVVLPDFVAHLRLKAPGIRVAALPFPDGDVRERLGDDLDCAIASERMMDDDVPSRRLFEDSFVLAFRKGHPRIGDAVDLDLFCTLDHLLVSPSGGGFTGAVDEVLSHLGRSRSVVASLPLFHLAPATLRRTDCVAVLPKRLAALDPAGLTTIPAPIRIDPFPTILGWHPRLSRDSGHRWFRQTVLELTNDDQKGSLTTGP